MKYWIFFLIISSVTGCSQTIEKKKCESKKVNEADCLIRWDGSPEHHRWKYVASVAGEKVYIPFEGYYESKGGRIQSPIISLQKKSGESAFYQIDFKAASPDECFWWVDLFDPQKKSLPDINSAVYPGKELRSYSQMIYVSGEAEYLQMAFVSKSAVSVRDIVIRRVDWQFAANWCDNLYKTLPLLHFSAPASSFQLLPKTEKALQTGIPFRILMLGDSIMNDSWNSIFQALLKREFPKSNLEFILSVRGSTGCWYYEKIENFQEYVGRHKPDLLIIGGISNIQDTKQTAAAMNSIESVVNQAKKIDCEVLLLSPAHSVDWRKSSESGQEWNENTLDYSGKQRLIFSPYQELAIRCGIAFWNITVPNATYIANSGKPHNYFNRDFIHNNERGKQIIGRILQEYFRKARK